MFYKSIFINDFILNIYFIKLKKNVLNKYILNSFSNLCIKFLSNYSRKYVIKNLYV